ncbi:MAG TPA: DUF4835 family protein [Bacteroidia bacterium]|jgi:hypothetical protein|nr:DUF4835 family protein [Bacteroidia bacterium]
MKNSGFFTGITCFLIFLTIPMRAQELNCTVQVLAPQIQGTTEKRIFEALKTSVYEFMNNTHWTKDNFGPQERITMSLTITVNTEIAIDQFTGTLQIQTNRPAYKSSYSCTIMNYSDNDFQFNYIEAQPMDFIETTFSNNLTSILAFYAYVAIAEDYDTFSLYGGTPYYQKAQQIVNMAQNAAEHGWKAFESTSQKNRYWLIENAMSSVFGPLRECMYKYHRQGFDVMYSDLATGRQAVYESLQMVQKVYQEKPASFNLQLFFSAKCDELVKLFSTAYTDEKGKAVTLLNSIDPANINKYNAILSSK